MKIESISNGCLRVWLADDEIEEWGLHREDAARDRRVRRLVRRVLRMAGCGGHRRLSAEMIPVEGGGVLLVSPLPHPSVEQPSVYRPADDDALLELMRQWQYTADDSQPLFSLYEWRGGYALAVYPTDPLTPRQFHILSEYGHLLGVGEGMVAHCAEYGTLLWAGKPLTEREPHLPAHEDSLR